MCIDSKLWASHNRHRNVPCLAPAEYSAILFQQDILLGEAVDVIEV